MRRPNVGLLVAIVLTCAHVSCARTRDLKAGGSQRQTSRKVLTIGEDDITGRIQNGEEAPVGRYPYIVSLRTLGTRLHFCGGSLIEPHIVLTAAHCVDPDTQSRSGVSEPIVFIGAHGVNDDESMGVEVINTVKTIMHSKWKSNDFFNGYDIALLVLERASRFKPVMMAPADVPKVGQMLASAGWGSDASGVFAEALNHVTDLQFIPNPNCNGPSLYDGKIKEVMLCAGGAGEDTCAGDSGGPLILADSKDNPSFDRLVGIVSFGAKECGAVGIPGVYTRTSRFRDWIEMQIREIGESMPQPLPAAVPSEGLPSSPVPSSSSSPPPLLAVPATTTAPEGIPNELPELTFEDRPVLPVDQAAGEAQDAVRGSPPDGLPAVAADAVPLQPSAVPDGAAVVDGGGPTPLVETSVDVPVEDALLSKDELSEKYKCQPGVPCENTKTRKTSLGETVCQCYAWLSTGFCHPNGWTLLVGDGGCDFPVEDR